MNINGKIFNNRTNYQIKNNVKLHEAVKAYISIFVIGQ